MPVDATFWKEQLEKREAALEAACELELKVLARPHQQYEYDYGDGSMQARVWSLKQVRDMVDALTASIDNIKRKLDGTSVVSVRLFR